MVLAVAGVAEPLATHRHERRHFGRPASAPLPVAMYERQGVVALILPDQVPDLCQDVAREVF